MFEPIGGMRKLKYPLYNQETNGNITDDAGLPLNEFIWPEDPEERTILPLFVSQREFTAILSAMDVGADIAYPEQYIEVMWLMVRNLRYGVNICEMIANCIATSEETRQAIRDFVTSDDDISNYFTEIVEGLTTEQIISPVVNKGCDNSDVAGAIVAIVERMDVYNIDALQIIEVGTNDEEKVAAVIGGIPVFETLPFDEVIDFAQDLLEDFFENYEGAITEEWKDDVEEDLYCLAKGKPDCKLTYEDLFNYFQDRAGSSLTTLSGILDVINFVRTGDFSTDELVASGMYALQLAFVRVGREFFGINLPKIGALTRDALPSTKWEEWADCIEPDTWIDNNFAGGNQHSWTSYTSSGIDFAIWIGDGFDRYQDSLQIAIKKTIPYTITDVEVYFNAPLSGSGGVMYAGKTDLTGLAVGGSTDDQMWSWSGLAITGGLGLDLYRPGGFASGQYVTRVRYKIDI